MEDQSNQGGGWAMGPDGRRHEAVQIVGAPWPRPDYVKCIRKSGRSSGKTVCGRYFTSFDWTFQDAEHAEKNEEQGGRLRICPECAAAIRKG